MIKAVIFDMDGLMFDTESAYSHIHSVMSQKRGKIFTNEIKNTLTGKRANEVISMLNSFWGKNESPESLFEEQDRSLLKMYNEFVEKMSGLDELIVFLKENGIRMCIGTSSRKFLVDVLLKKHHLDGVFEFVVSGDMVQKGKPDPEIYTKCISLLGVLASECLVLEDSLNGVKAGKAAGCFVCSIPSEYTKDEDFSIASLKAVSLADKSIQNFICSQKS